MNPHAVQPTSFAAMVRSLTTHRSLIVQMARREVVGRYRGSILGLAWSFFNPLLMLTVYTFVFSVVFKARWGDALSGVQESRTDFAILLFAGLIVNTLFSEVLNRAPSLILTNQNFVKRVVFPLEILPVITVCAALFHGLVSLLVLLFAFSIFNGYMHWTALFAPMLFVPLAFLALGLAWILASLGVFLRDVGQTIGLITMLLMFLAPVFYPVNALPAELRPWLMLNPITFIIEQTRSVVVWGKIPNWFGLAIYSTVATSVAWIGYVWFQKTRKGFADVL